MASTGEMEEVFATKKNMSHVHGVLEGIFSYVSLILSVIFSCLKYGSGNGFIPHNYAFCFRPVSPCLHIRSNLNPLGLMECWDFFGFRFMVPFGVIIVTTWMDHGLIAIRLELLKPPCGKVLLVKCNNQPFAKHGTSWEIEKLDHQTSWETENLDHRNPWIEN